MDNETNPEAVDVQEDGGQEVSEAEVESAYDSNHADGEPEEAAADPEPTATEPEGQPEPQPSSDTASSNTPQ